MGRFCSRLLLTLLHLSDMPPTLLGTYNPPAVHKGEVVSCLYRDADCVVTGFHDGRIPWPRVRAREHRGGSGLWVNEELAQAIRTESAAALMHWFGVGSKAVWGWRRAFVKVPGKFRTPGSKIAHAKASQAGGKAMREKDWTDEELDAKAELSKRLGLRPTGRWKGTGHEWTAAEVKLLAKMTNAEVAVKTGRTVEAVRMKRRKAGVESSRPTP